MPRARERRAPCGPQEARVRYAQAVAYLQVAASVLDEEAIDDPVFLNVSAGLAVLAGIAASDALCCKRLGQRHRGDDHRGAASMVERAVPDGSGLAAALGKLLDVKDAAHYGIAQVSATRTKAVLRQAEKLVQRAGEELER